MDLAYDDSETAPSQSTVETLVALNTAICTEARRRAYTERLVAGDKGLARKLLLSHGPIENPQNHLTAAVQSAAAHR